MRRTYRKTDLTFQARTMDTLARKEDPFDGAQGYLTQIMCYSDPLDSAWGYIP
jgi:hypothetical protein